MLTEAFNLFLLLIVSLRLLTAARYRWRLFSYHAKLGSVTGICGVLQQLEQQYTGELIFQITLPVAGR